MTTPPPDKAVERLTAELASVDRAWPDAHALTVFKSDLSSVLSQLAAANQRIAELEAGIEQLSKQLSGMTDLAEGYRVRAEAAEAQLAAQSRALESIAKNTCCDTCQEAARVAQSALRRAAQASGEGGE